MNTFELFGSFLALIWTSNYPGGSCESAWFSHAFMPLPAFTRPFVALRCVTIFRGRRSLWWWCSKASTEGQFFLDHCSHGTSYTDGQAGKKRNEKWHFVGRTQRLSSFLRFCILLLLLLRSTPIRKPSSWSKKKVVRKTWSFLHASLYWITVFWKWFYKSHFFALSARKFLREIKVVILTDFCWHFSWN